MAMDTTTKKTDRDLLIERYRSEDPEGDYQSEGALERRVLSDLDNYKSKLGRYDEESKKLNDLFANNDMAAALLNAWATGENPINFLLENFGDEFKDALDSPEGREAFVESHNKWLKKKASDNEAAAQRDDNFRESLEKLEKWRTQNGLSEEDAVKVFVKINTIAADAIDGIYSEESFDIAKKAMDYDNDVSIAREDGIIEGRNAKIEERFKKAEELDKLPPTLGGQGATSPEHSQKPKSYTDIFGIMG